MRDSKERLQDILEAISAIERYLGRGRASFEQDELLQVCSLSSESLGRRPVFVNRAPRLSSQLLRRMGSNAA